MSSSRAELYKREFRYKWRDGVIREWIVKQLLDLIFMQKNLPYRVLWTGVGAGNAEYVEENYDSPLNAFDLVIVDENMKIMAYLEITGTKDLEKGEELCIGAWKIFKAERFNVQDKVWYIHVLSSKIPIRVINYHRLRKIASFRQLHETSLVCGKFYCSKTSKWGSINDLIRWLQVKKK